MKWSWQQRGALGLAAVVVAALGCTQPVAPSGATSDPNKKKPTASPNASEKKMSVTKASFGKLPDGTEVDLYTLANANGVKVKIATLGATITSVEVPDRNGKIENVTLFRDSLEDYLKKDTPYFGATVGRYANRIAKGKFTLDGKEYTLATNNKQNHLHGGNKGFDKAVWKAKPGEGKDTATVVFTYESADGEEGYPGRLLVQATHTLTDQDELKIEYQATTDKPTVLNLANHAYWNLAGAGSGTILDQVMMINADRFLATDEGLIPLPGEPKPVKGTPMDFNEPTPIGARKEQVDASGGLRGYDHCYVLNQKNAGEMTLAARVVEPKSGRVLEITTTQPAIQFYSGNFLDGTIKAGGKTYEQYYGFCLETEHYPDSPNRPDYPTTELKPGGTYKQTTVHKFSVQK